MLFIISLFISLASFGQELIAFYPFNNNANDESGYGYDGTVNGAVPSIDRFGNINSAYTFNGLNNNILATGLPILQEFTVSGWFRTSVSDRRMNMFDLANFLGLATWEGDSLGAVLRKSVGAFVGLTAQTFPTDNNWHLGVATYDKTTLKLYFDGVLVNSLPVSTIHHDFDPMVLRIGSITGDFWWDGAIDDVRVFDRALTDSQILILYGANGWPLAMTPTDILSFSVPGQVGATTIDSESHTIYLEVIGGTSLNGLAPEISVFAGSSVVPTSGSSQDFRNPVTYTVTAQDGITKQDWEIMVKTNTAIQTGTVTDVEGNIYKTVKIGNQWWMTESMRSARYADETELVDGVGAGDINSDYSTKYHFPADNSIINVPTYGYLYTWAAAMNGSSEPGAQGVCPSGWHVPTDDEFKVLELTLGMAANALDSSGFRGPGIGGKLKEVGFFSWLDPNLGGINSNGFRAIPGGSRNPDGSYSGFGTEYSVWTSNAISANQAWSRKLTNDSIKIGRLLPEKDYGFAVRCVNTDVIAPQVSNINLPEFYRIGFGDVQASVNIDDQVEMRRVSFHVRRADQEEWNVIDLPLSDLGEYSVTLKEDDVTQLGLLYFFQGEDVSGNVASTDTVLITYEYVSENSPIIPNLKAGGTASDWRMFSVPYFLADKRIATIFEQKLGAYNKKSWRLLQYDNSFSETKFREYKEGLTNIEPGKGYWFNSVAEANLRIGTSFVPKYTLFTPATISLEAGWNQIGNPYIFDVVWQDVLDANGLTSAELEPLRVYNGGAGLADETILKLFSGAYVHSDQQRTIGIPFQINTSGRLATSDDFEEGWLVQLELSSADRGNSLSGFGMHPEALNEHDGRDRIRVPRFGDYIDASFVHPQYFSPNFGRDVVEEKANYTWEFIIESSIDEEIRTISWEITNSNEIDHLLLYDLKNGSLIDMLKESNYSFVNDNSRQFKAIFGDRDYVIEQLASGVVSLGENYPNPLTNQTIIPYVLYGEEEEFQVQIKLFALDGSLVTNLLTDTKPPGSYQLEWDGRDANGRKLSGLYIYSMEVNTLNGLVRLHKKLIVR